ncbi:MAG TPA: hypothetical protein PK089_07470 [Methanoregulaceae archaeon]|nr:hypothetical protein [Methanoregulaceae archaeon]HOV67153.1 hypothetical protein [Methanoregulaceae archaeon]HQJ87031.1 hypothetical protein [Methanoregulaceae archaeon]
MIRRGGNEEEEDFPDEGMNDAFAEDEEDEYEEWFDPGAVLEDVADDILEECEEDVACIAARLDGLDPELRWELLGSNLLNAWQVFFYIFRFEPDDLTRERLELEPALATRSGVLLEHRDLFELLFFVRDRRGFIGVSDGEALLARFEGPEAYDEARAFVDENA